MTLWTFGGRDFLRQYGFIREGMPWITGEMVAGSNVTDRVHRIDRISSPVDPVGPDF